MEAFDMNLGNIDERYSYPTFYAEERIKAVDGVHDAKVLPNEKGNYIAHVRLKIGADQVSVLLEASAIQKDYAYTGLTGIQLYSENLINSNFDHFMALVAE